ncbi:uncharacterized protein LOC111832589 [Capsella rubella]|uniref:uncharacterized protein LOC111832589 n=1 Tax=Capsella rubella TaxID=81985 RepID=UPI000CD54222|nr:uncharacterized protein LOC111832589 [Capsella rubella]
MRRKLFLALKLKLKPWKKSGKERESTVSNNVVSQIASYEKKLAASETIPKESAVSTSIASEIASPENNLTDSESILGKESSSEVPSSEDSITENDVLIESSSEVASSKNDPIVSKSTTNCLTVIRHHLIRDLPRSVQRSPVVPDAKPPLSRSARKKLNKGPGSMSLTAAQKRKFGHRKGKKKYDRERDDF